METINNKKQKKVIIDFDELKYNAHTQLSINENSMRIFERPFFEISFDNFCDLIKPIGRNSILKNRGLMRNYDIDSDNLPILKQLYYWLTGDEKNFIGDLYKGFLIVGTFGTGKSILMDTFITLFSKFINSDKNLLNKIIIETLDIEKLERIFKNDTLHEYSSKIIVLDDIGKELNELNIYGNKISPMVKFIEYRYNKRYLTFGTSNFNLKSLETKYGKYISSRIDEMCNIMELNGTIRRK